MNKEKIILSFIAIAFGLIVAGIAFYFYQTTKPIDNNSKTISIVSPTPEAKPSITLTLDAPIDEEVVDKNELTVSGKTTSNATVVITTDISQDVITPEEDGKFSTTVTLDDGQNMLEVTAISPNGENVTIKRTVTYSEEEF
jgi:hypothetical protein